MPTPERPKILTESDKPHHECAVVGIYHPTDEITPTAFYALLSMQNRGQESSGIASFDGQTIHLQKDIGIVYQALGKPENLTHLKGQIAIGHNRYGTTGSPSKENAQPIVEGNFALAHNGNIINAAQLKSELLTIGETFSSTSDSEVLAKVIIHSSGQTWQEKISNAAKRVEGAYTLTLIADGKLMAVRDPRGFWPLSIGRFNETGFLFASESSALDYCGVEFLREVEPGEIVTLEDGLLVSDFIEPRQEQAFCIFEYFYLSAPISIHMGRRVYMVRKDMGRGLWEEQPVEADLVVPVPETAIPAALGFSEASGIPLEGALLKNRNLLRIFIEPDQRLRELGVKLKYAPLWELINGKRLVIIDDSIVRGTTTGPLVRLLFQNGAEEVHLRITAPPIQWPCYFGIDFPTKKELIAADHLIEETAAFLGATSLGHLSLERAFQAIGENLQNRLCTACFTGRYPMPVPNELDKYVLETR